MGGKGKKGKKQASPCVQVNLMGKGKNNKVGESKTGQVPTSLCHHLALPGEGYVSLPTYLEEHPPEVITEQPPGQSQSQPAPAPEQLGGSTRLLMFSVLDMIDDFVNEGICLEDLKTQNIVVLPNGCPKLTNVKFQERKDLTLEQFKARVEENYVGLALVFRHEIVERLSCIPADVSHLIYLMENCPWAMRLLITYHSSVVPLSNSFTLFIRLYNYIFDVLREKDPKGYYYVVRNMEFDPAWRQLLAHNQHLDGYLQNSNYVNSFPPGTEAFLLREGRLVGRYNRNVGSHPLELALDSDPSSSDGMLYTQCLGLGHIQHAYFERLTYSMQVGLQSINKLRLVEIQSLFSNNPKQYKEIV